MIQYPVEEHEGPMIRSNDQFNELCRLEPRLRTLYASALACHAEKHDTPTDVWFLRFKPRLLKLVGWYAEQPDPALHSSEAYDIAYQYILTAIPDWDIDEEAYEGEAFWDEDEALV